MNSHDHKTRLFMTTTVLLGFMGLGACSSTGGTSAGDTAGEAVAGGVFSNLNELDYTASSEEASIATGDMLDIKVFQAEELSGKVRVDSNGQISLPLIGAFNVAGSTPIEVETKIKGLLGKTYLQNPQITVFMESFTNQRLTLEGEVRKPGVYPIAGSATLLQAIAMGEGLSDLADPAKVVLFRRVGNQTKAYNLNIDAIRSGKMRDPYIRGDDRIIAHRSDSRYWTREVTDTIRGFITPF
jgi:polysaccharide export outer membrane protein